MCRCMYVWRGGAGMCGGGRGGGGAASQRCVCECVHEGGGAVRQRCVHVCGVSVCVCGGGL